MLKRQEEKRFYTTKYNSVNWYKITARIAKRESSTPWSIIEIRIDTNDNILYNYQICFPCSKENAKKFAETIIKNLNPKLIPTTKNDKPKFRHNRFWTFIEDKKNNRTQSKYIQLDGKKFSFIRCYTHYEYLNYFVVNVTKKIKLNKVDEKTHIKQWLKEWYTYDAYIPQFESIYWICEKLKTKKDKLYKRHNNWLWNTEAENFIDRAISKYIEESVLSISSLFEKQKYSYDIVWDKKLPNNLSQDSTP